MRGKPRLIRGKVGAMLQAYADTVVKSVMDERGLSELQFRKSNYSEHVQARRDAINMLHADGFGITEISKLVRMSEKTVECHLRPAARKARQIRSMNYHREARA